MPELGSFGRRLGGPTRGNVALVFWLASITGCQSPITTDSLLAVRLHPDQSLSYRVLHHHSSEGPDGPVASRSQRAYRMRVARSHANGTWEVLVTPVDESPGRHPSPLRSFWMFLQPDGVISRTRGLTYRHIGFTLGEKSPDDSADEAFGNTWWRLFGLSPGGSVEVGSRWKIESEILMMPVPVILSSEVSVLSADSHKVTLRIVGEVSRSSRLPDGAKITTSNVIGTAEISSTDGMLIRSVIDVTLGMLVPQAGDEAAQSVTTLKLVIERVA